VLFHGTRWQAIRRVTAPLPISLIQPPSVNRSCVQLIPNIVIRASNLIEPSIAAQKSDILSGSRAFSADKNSEKGTAIASEDSLRDTKHTLSGWRRNTKTSRSCEVSWELEKSTLYPAEMPFLLRLSCGDFGLHPKLKSRNFKTGPRLSASKRLSISAWLIAP
jgi:hypothetical protein